MARTFPRGWDQPQEQQIRAQAEALKVEVVKRARAVRHPCLMVDEEAVEQARTNLKLHDWARQLVDSWREQADLYLDRPELAAARVPEETPVQPFGFFCPRCRPHRTHRCEWDFRDPDHISCVHCGAKYPDPEFPEDVLLSLPRSGKELRFWVRPEERDDPQFESGKHAYRWVGWPVHDAFSGFVRYHRLTHLCSLVQQAGFLFALGGDARYALLAANILRRLAEVYPAYLLHDYWQHYFDGEPLWGIHLLADNRRETVIRFERLLCRDRPGQLFQTLWGCGRMGGGGMQREAELLIMLARGADLIWEAKDREGAPVLADQDKDRIISDLLAEGLLTFSPWDGINNKIGTCRAGEVALGKFCNAPDYVHRALDRFGPFLRHYFNLDGTLSEGPTYFQYTFHNLWQTAEELQGYTDPDHYQEPDRVKNLGMVERFPLWSRILRAGVHMLLPWGELPVVADTHVASREKPSNLPSEMAARRLSERTPLPDTIPEALPAYRADLWYSLFFRDPEAATESKPVEDRIFPGWGVAMLHAGEGDAEDRPALSAVLSFYHPTGHSHADGLNLALYSNGKEIFSDLGYIGDDPGDAWLRQTVAHNTVVVDEEDQIRLRPAGICHNIALTAQIKMLQVGQMAYLTTPGTYQRQIILVALDPEEPYLLDIFRVSGGTIHDYAFHPQRRLASPFQDGPGNEIAFQPYRGPHRQRVREGGHLKKFRRAMQPPTPWNVLLRCPAGRARLTMLSPVDEILVAEAPGQREFDDIGTRMEVIMARSRPPADLGATFVALLQPNADEESALQAKEICAGEGASRSVVVEISRPKATDLVIANKSVDPIELDDLGLVLDGLFALYRRNADGSQALTLYATRRFSGPGLEVEIATPEFCGPVVEQTETAFQVDQDLPQELVGEMVLLGGAAYRISGISGRWVEVADYPLVPATEYRIPITTIVTCDTSGRIEIESPIEVSARS